MDEWPKMPALVAAVGFLAIAYGIIDLYVGWINLRSNVGFDAMVVVCGFIAVAAGFAMRKLYAIESHLRPKSDEPKRPPATFSGLR